MKVTPDFLENRIKIQLESNKRNKNGKHLVLGREPSSNSILLGNNDYLSVSGHPEVMAAQIESLRSNGNGVLRSSVFLQGNNLKKRFEDRMATYLGFESAILCQSGWVANIGLIQTIANKNVPVYIDILAHMSLWEGVKVAGANAFPFSHNNIDDCEKLIQKHGKGVIVVDSVYSIDGSICPLDEIAEVAYEYGCVLVVDESHSLGTHGKDGSGLVNDLRLNDKVHFITASLSKAFAGRAGLITCSKDFMEYFSFNSFPAIFSSVILPHEISALDKTLDVIKNADDLRDKLHENANYLRNELSELGYNVSSGNSQIISLEPGTEELTEILRDELEQHDIFGAVFCKPATSKNRAVIRFSINSSLTKKELDYIIETCKEIRCKVNLWDWKSTKRIG